MLNNENQSFILELIGKLESGGDPEGLMNLATRMNQAAGRHN